MQILKQSTASQAIKLGAFVDDTDGKTAESGLTIANTDIQISKAGGAFGDKTSGGATADGIDGWYTATLDATDTATIGTLDVQVHVAGALPVQARYQVVSSNTFDSLFSTLNADYLHSDMTAIDGNTVSATNLKESTTALEATTVSASPSPTTTSFALSAGSTVDDVYVNRAIFVISGTNKGLFIPITGYVGSTKVVSFDSTIALTATDKVVIA